MEKLKTAGIYILLTLVCFVLMALLPVYMLYVPVDILLYYSSPYYKASKRRYTHFIRGTRPVKIYNRLVRHGIRMTWHNEEIEYYISDGVLLFPEYDRVYLDCEDGGWYADFYENGDECPVKVTELLVRYMAMVKPEHQHLPARLLICSFEMDKDSYEQAKECPWFVCYQV